MTAVSNRRRALPALAACLLLAVGAVAVAEEPDFEARLAPSHLDSTLELEPRLHARDVPLTDGSLVLETDSVLEEAVREAMTGLSHGGPMGDELDLVPAAPALPDDTMPYSDLDFSSVAR